MSRAYPILHTERLTLRPFRVTDAPEVKRMAGHPDVAATTLNIPHPYPDGAAEEWISCHPSWWDEGQCVSFALEDRMTGKLVGCVSLDIAKQHRRGMLGYWVGKEYWNRGFCTEGVKRVIEFAFKDLQLVKVWACYLASNPSSGRVMQKAGMSQEGSFRKHVIKNGESRDCIYYGVIS